MRPGPGLFGPSLYVPSTSVAPPALATHTSSEPLNQDRLLVSESAAGS
ncbi:hypothetical protein [Jatrophihabitans lederbergiae]|nr:hypothetical protein [Jatrophihabitans sp. DSM 44399]